METKLSTFAEVAEKTERKLVEYVVGSIEGHNGDCFVKFTADINDLFRKATLNVKQLSDFAINVESTDYNGRFTLNVVGMGFEKIEKYNERVARILTQTNEKEKRKQRKEADEADRKAIKYQHYLEMKQWAEENGLKS